LQLFGCDPFFIWVMHGLGSIL